MTCRVDHSPPTLAEGPDVLIDACSPADSVGDAPAPKEYGEPTTDTQRVLAEILADLVGAERVSVDSHFFDDLGADSLVMARFCARVAETS